MASLSVNYGIRSPEIYYVARYNIVSALLNLPFRVMIKIVRVWDTSYLFSCIRTTCHQNLNTL